MKKRFIGNLEVSEIGMGTMAFSHGYGQIPSEEYSIAAIRKAYSLGCTFFDTAEVYGNVLYEPGHNERIVGKAIEEFRTKIILATKFFIEKKEYVDKNITLYDALLSHIKQSLKNLKTDYIDLYYLHRINEEIPVEEIAEVMKKFIEEKLIRGWGLSAVGLNYIERAHKVCPVTAVQNIYNLLERDAEKEVIPFCLKNNIGFVPFSPVSSGILGGKIDENTKFEEKDDVRNWVPQCRKENIIKNKPLIEYIRSFANKKNCTMAQLSLAWMVRKYPNCVPIPGSKNLEKIIENIESYKVELNEKELEEFENGLSKFTIYGHRGQEETFQLIAKLIAAASNKDNDIDFSKK